MTGIEGLIDGLSVALTPTNLLLVLIGVVIGMIVGVLPGLGPTATIAMLLPVTFTLDPASAVIMLAGIYYGAMYGGTVTAVLVKVPGEVASVVTTFDGYVLATKGRAGSALGVAAIGSFVGGLLSVVFLVALAQPVANLASEFGPPELFLIALLGLLLVLAIASGSLIKAALMASLGLLITTVGQDPLAGSPRFTFGSLELLGGLDIVAVAMGVFGIGEALSQLTRHDPPITPVGVRSAFPTRADLRASRGPILRGSVIGSVLGVIPGSGGVIPPMASYAVERRLAKDPSRFGKGAIEGVAGPETANNAGSQTSFLPLLTLGLPTSMVMALMFGALLLQGITPGPTLVTDHPDVFWGIIASMLLGNIILLVLNLPLAGVFAQLLRIRPSVIGIVTILVTLLGVYSIGNSVFDVWTAIVAGAIGFALTRAGFELGPLVLAAILGPLLEKNLRISLTMGDGSAAIFVERPIAVVLCVLIVLAVASASVKVLRNRRRPRTGGLQARLDSFHLEPSTEADTGNLTDAHAAEDPKSKRTALDDEPRAADPVQVARRAEQ